ncbi:pyridoxamine 5'-phosphate oxidase family protein [Streptomyces sp. NPDC004728]|uniref:pyridoxamine 5'-phosphate oxidase family protein n=1 Tax=Streptomyces sp. NPDC004728 TaxID=3154289 RepID=UPI0033AA6319
MNQSSAAGSRCFTGGHGRIVKDIADGYVYFATPADSRKGLEIAENPHVSAHFH